MDSKNISSIRRDYGVAGLNKEDTHESPLLQFDKWLAEALQTEQLDPTAMVVSTVDDKGHPDSRIMLLKGLEDGMFIFYTNYQSMKAAHIATTPYVALNFYWPSLGRQVRVRGRIEQISEKKSDDYFASRPRGSQLSAIVSNQSTEIQHRGELEEKLNELLEKHQSKPIDRPKHWGGYQVTPHEMEFFQGRDSRLHDRIHYDLRGHKWHVRRLAP